MRIGCGEEGAEWVKVRDEQRYLMLGDKSRQSFGGIAFKQKKGHVEHLIPPLSLAQTFKHKRIVACIGAGELLCQAEDNSQ